MNQNQTNQTNPIKKWNTTIRKAVIAATGLPPEVVVKQWQTSGLTTPMSFASYSLNNISLQGRPYSTRCDFVRWYDLEYVVSFYGPCSRNLAMQSLDFMFTQHAKDIIYPSEMSYTNGFVMASLTEMLNAMAYNRTDINLLFSACLSEKNADYIDKLNLSFYEG